MKQKPYMTSLKLVLYSLGEQWKLDPKVDKDVQFINSIQYSMRGLERVITQKKEMASKLERKKQNHVPMTWFLYTEKPLMSSLKTKC